MPDWVVESTVSMDKLDVLMAEWYLGGDSHEHGNIGSSYASRTGGRKGRGVGKRANVEDDEIENDDDADGPGTVKRGETSWGRSKRQRRNNVDDDDIEEDGDSDVPSVKRRKVVPQVDRRT